MEDHVTKKKRQIEASILRVDGKKALLKINDPEYLRKINKPQALSVTTIGKDEPSISEDQLRDMILQRLMGRGGDAILIEKVPLVKIVWDTPPESSLFQSRPASAKRGATTSRKIAARAVTTKLNPSQARAVTALCNPLDPSYQRPIVQVVQGPPGSGKTTMISAMVQWLYKQSKEPIYLVTQSNIAVKNIAEKLENTGFRNYKIIVAHEFKNEWFANNFFLLFVLFT